MVSNASSLPYLLIYFNHSCAVFYRSPHYRNQSKIMHEHLTNTDVYTSPNIGTTLKVKLRKGNVKVPADRTHVIVRQEAERLRIIVPMSKADRKSAYRNQLPRALAEKLAITGCGAEKQIYRFLNETDMDIDKLLDDEEIPHVDLWLTKTRKSRSPEVEATLRKLSSSDDESIDEAICSKSAVSIESGGLEETRVTVSGSHRATSYTRRRRGSLYIPLIVDHLDEAPEYTTVLKHVLEQAASIYFRKNASEKENTTRTPLMKCLDGLKKTGTRGIKVRDYPELFGGEELMFHRVGAAGEILVSNEILLARLKSNVLIKFTDIRYSEEAYWSENQV